jgi:hypothetical protein
MLLHCRFSPPDDPLGKHGPSLDTFLTKSLPQPAPNGKAVCPYLGKCTYGNKCKYYHPDREAQHKNRQVIDKLLDKQKTFMQGKTGGNVGELITLCLCLL